MLSRKPLLLLTMLFSLAFAGAVRAADYELVQPPQPTEVGGKIQVMEFFWYGCPHCYHLEDSVEQYLKNLPSDVAFVRVPAYPSESWGDMARMYYTIQAMGLESTMHRKIFDAIHKDHVNLVNPKIRDEWLAKNGVDPKKYDDVAKSFTVVSNLQRAKQLTQAFKVDSVPRLVVGGKYYTSGETAGGPERIFPVVDEMVAKVRSETGRPAPKAK